MANMLQIAVINKMLPKGFKFELYDTIRKQTEKEDKVAKGPYKRRKVGSTS